MLARQVWQPELTGERIGVVFGSFAPLHKGHMDLIMRAKKENDGCLVIVCGNAGDKGGDRLPPHLRYQYTREAFKDDPLVSVYFISGYEGYSFDQWTPWLKDFHELVETAVKSESPKLTFYVGEQEYHDDLVKLGYQCELIDRRVIPVSGTEIRANPIKYWRYIAHPFRRALSHNILVIGTASEGKSTLVSDLAKYFNTSFAHEWPRDYIERYNLCDWEFDQKHFMNFLIGQHSHIEQELDNPANCGVFFCDSDAMTTEMYARAYAKESECRLTMNDLFLISHVAEQAAHWTKWDKIYVMPPHGSFVDDHTRYMAHSDMSSRRMLLDIMMEIINRNGLMGRVEFIDGSYFENFEIVRQYTEEVLSRE